MLKPVVKLLNSFGLNYKVFLRSLRGWPYFWRDWRAFKKQVKQFPEWKSVTWYPILRERFEDSAILTGHYFQQDLLVARRIFENKPERHIDIGSRVDGFVAHVAAFREIEVFDIRPQTRVVHNVKFTVSDLTKWDDSMRGYAPSLSCLHVIEHFGLGRYGDTIDLAGHLKGLANIGKLLAPGGRFYFSTPIGPQRIEFNAHRVFSVKYLLDLFNDHYTIINFSYINDKGILFENVALTEEDVARNFGCFYGCGVWEMIRK